MSLGVIKSIDSENRKTVFFLRYIASSKLKQIDFISLSLIIFSLLFPHLYHPLTFINYIIVPSKTPSQLFLSHHRHHHYA